MAIANGPDSSLSSQRRGRAVLKAVSRSGAARLAIAVAVAVVAAGGVLWADWRHAAPPNAMANAKFVGRQACVECHQAEHTDWLGSHHDKAMDFATDQSVLADFDNSSFTRNGVTTRFFRDGERFMVNAEGPDGQMRDYEVKYTFGVEPLQQYLVELPPTDGRGAGRVQVLRVSWNTKLGEWFEVTPPDVPDDRILPGDPLHWTGIGQNWNTTCAVCHSTNLEKNYDLASDSYATTWSEIDVSCEACHGPASLHLDLAKAKSLFWDRRHGYGLAKLKGHDPTAQIETCAECHSRRNAVHASFRPGTPLLDSYEPALLDEGLYHADGQILDEVYVYGSFLQSKMHHKGVRCTDCHNPHSLELKFEGNALCAQCHQPAKYDVVAHHRHPLPAGDASQVSLSGETGKIGTGTACVDCHMRAWTYMNVDPRRDHSFRIPRPDLTVLTGSPNACNGCHTKREETPEWAAAKVVEWYGDKRPDDPHWAPAIAAGRNGDPEGERLLAALVRRDSAPAIVRATAVDLLSRYSTLDAQQEVRSQLDSLDPLVRNAATNALQTATIDELVETIAPRLTDPVRAVRIHASRRLAGAPLRTLDAEQFDALKAGIEEYRQQQDLQLEHAASHLNLAGLAGKLGDTRIAITELRLAIQREPYLSGPRARLAQTLVEVGGSRAEVRRLREEEVGLLRRDTELLPTSSPTRYQLGLLLFQIGRLEESEAALAEACRLAPRSQDFRMMLALLQERRYEKTGDAEHFDAAVASLRKLAALDPDDSRARSILRRLLATRKTKQASED